MSDNTQGSTWNRWDLHLHTPGTAKEDHYEGSTLDEKWENFIETINGYQGEVPAVAITDYFSIDNYQRFLAEKPKITKRIGLVLPNVELRMLPVTGSSTPINIHCIFNPAIADDLERRFFSRLHFASDTAITASRANLMQLGRDNAAGATLDDDAAYKRGIEQFQTDINSLKEIFQTDIDLAKDTIIVVANGSGDGVSGIVQHSTLLTATGSQLDTTRRNIYCMANAIFSANAGDIEYFLGKKVGADGHVIAEDKVIEKAGSLKPCFHGCDAHTNAKVFNPDEQRYCWIKAELTFEGLKQTLYEPELRVAIQKDSPHDDNQKLALTSFGIADSKGFKLTDQDISLNRDLVAIIGGRGSGKSLLLETIASMNEEHDAKDRNGKPKVIESYRQRGADAKLSAMLKNKDNVEEPFAKQLMERDQLDLPILYIGQEKLSSIATDDERLTPTVSSFLGIESDAIESEEIEGIVEFDLAEIDAFTRIIAGLNERYVKSFDVGDKPFLDKLKDFREKKEKQIKRLTSAETEVLVEKLRSVIDQGQKAKNVSERLPALESALKTLPVNKNIDATNELLRQVTGLASANIPRIDVAAQLQAVNAAGTALTKKRGELTQEYLKITQQLKALGVKEDVRLLTESIRKLQDELNEIDADAKAYADAQTELQSYREELKNVGQDIKKLVDSRVTKINDAFRGFVESNALSDAKEQELFASIIKGVGVEGEITFDEHKFVNLLITECFDGRAVKDVADIRKAILGSESTQPITFNDFVTFWQSGKVWPLLEQYKFNKDGREKFIDIIFNRWQQYVAVRTKISLDGVPVENLSVGQRGTLLLKIYLASATDKQIFIIDQPEDNLDNKFISEEMVPMLRKIKQSRQVILSTHNANIVVGCDADQVIVARLDEKQSTDRLYVTGGIENEKINHYIQTILEGGSKALAHRYRRYM